MAFLDSLLSNVESLAEGLQTGSVIRDVVIDHEDDILNKQREQLFEGKNGKGEDIHPYYSEDLQPGGYFKTPEAAKSYADWKRSLSYPVQATRNPDAPNLYIVGKFHSELAIVFGTDTMTITGEDGWASGIVAKYGLEQFGISDERWADLFENYGILKELNDKIRKTIWQ